jgi:YHS domain-containing protein
LDSFEALMKGGDSGPTVVAGKQAESDLVRRVRLPVDDEDHMPPEGKPQLHADDVALLAWWIDSGASEQKTVAELKPSPRIAEIIATRLGAPVPAAPSGAETAPPKPLHEVVPVAETLGGELGIPIVPLSQAEPWLQVNAGIAAASFGDEQLLKLKAIGLNLRWLDLAGTKVTDAGLAHLAAMPNLVRLHLQRTAVSDDGLAQLASLGNLEYLNLYGTAVSDAGLDQLKALPKLRQVYLWQSKVTPTAARAFAEGRIDQAQVRGWQEQIEQLQAKIRNSKIVVDTGNMTVVVPAVSSGSLNRECPVSGRTADRSKTITYEGRLVAFCCDDCKAKFQQDPKLYLSKLPPISPAAEHKPVNAKCPVSDKDVDPAKTITYEGRLVAFCCDDCKAKFQQDPKSYLDKLPPASASTDAKPK